MKTRRPDTPKPPSHLSREAKILWRNLTETFADWLAVDLERLAVALQALDRMTQARKVIDAEGITTTDRFGTVKKHPAISVEENARVAYLRALRELGLDSEAVASTRPPQIRGRR